MTLPLWRDRLLAAALLVTVWMLLWGVFSWANLVTGLIVAAVVLTVFPLPLQRDVRYYSACELDRPGPVRCVALHPSYPRTHGNCYPGDSAGELWVGGSVDGG